MGSGVGCILIAESNTPQNSVVHCCVFIYVVKVVERL
jgi:hypothetical protein